MGLKHLSLPTAGNAGAALAAYAAVAGLSAHIAMPADTPKPFVDECRLIGADVILIDGFITDCGSYLRQAGQGKNWFDVSTLKEPYRIEGKKLMGYELAFQFNWNLPNVIVYPIGGGTGLIGMWKAFTEMEQLGWIGKQKPRMVIVQSAGCAPLVRAFRQERETAVPWEKSSTIALGLRVPRAIGDFLILKAIRDSNGTAIMVSDSEIMQSLRLLAQQEGILAGPEGAATVAATKKLVQQGWLKPDDKIVLLNTGSVYNYLDLI